MNGHHISNIVLVFFAVAISAGVAYGAWRRRPASGAAAFAVLMLAVAERALVLAFELTATDLAAKIFWAKASFVGLVAIPVVWLIFVLQYTGTAKWQIRRVATVLSIVPLVSLLLAWTNEAHHWFYSDVGLSAGGAFDPLEVQYGGWFYFHGYYSYTLLLFGIFLLVKSLWHPTRIYRDQVIILLAAVLVSFVANLIETVGLDPLGALPLTPLALALSGSMIFWGMFSFRILDLMPVACDVIIEGMNDGVIVLDAHRRIVDLNPAAQRIIGQSVVGQLAEQAFAGCPQLIAHWRNGADTRFEISLVRAGQSLWYDGQIAPLCDRQGNRLGQLITLRDMTERKRAEEKLYYLSSHDILTGLYNRAFFEEELSRLEGGRRFPVSILIADVDGLKAINDRQGHAAGDALLRRAAQVLQAGLRVEDVLARIGGDEFAALLPDTPTSIAEDIVTRLRNNLQAHNVLQCNEPALALSFGIATGERGCSLNDLLNEADKQMYREKSGRVG